MENFDQKYLKEALTYYPETGEFWWRKDRPDSHFSSWRGRNAFEGNVDFTKPAGYIPPPTKRNPSPYMVIGICGKLYKAHRLAWLYVYGEWPEEDIDHIDQNPLNNRIINLRLSVDKLNHRNRGRYKNNTSGVSGLSFHRRTNKWQAEGQEIINGKRIRHYLGIHSDWFDAVCARKSWEFRMGYSPTHGKDVSRPSK